MKMALRFDTPPTCSFYMHSLASGIMLGTLFFNFITPSYKDLKLLCFMGCSSGIAQILATNAYRISNVSILSPIDYLSIL